MIFKLIHLIFWHYFSSFICVFHSLIELYFTFLALRVNSKFRKCEMIAIEAKLIEKVIIILVPNLADGAKGGIFLYIIVDFLEGEVIRCV
jgi:hypothetical protein